MPGIVGWRKDPPGSLEGAEDMPLERLSILILRHTSTQFLGYDNAEMLEWRERSVSSGDHRLDQLEIGRARNPGRSTVGPFDNVGTASVYVELSCVAFLGVSRDR